MKKVFYAKIEMEVPKVHNGVPIYPDYQICENIAKIIKAGLISDALDENKLKVIVQTKPITLIGIISPSKN